MKFLLKKLFYDLFKTENMKRITLKLRHYEKATKFEKNHPLVSTKQPFLRRSIKTSGRFFQNCVAFSEKLNFIKKKP